MENVISASQWHREGSSYPDECHWSASRSAVCCPKLQCTLCMGCSGQWMGEEWWPHRPCGRTRGGGGGGGGSGEGCVYREAGLSNKHLLSMSSMQCRERLTLSSLWHPWSSLQGNTRAASLWWGTAEVQSWQGQRGGSLVCQKDSTAWTEQKESLSWCISTQQPCSILSYVVNTTKTMYVAHSHTHLQFAKRTQ